MGGTAVLLLLFTGLASGQLNFDGNPLTEDTEYTAEESQYSQRSINDKTNDFTADQIAVPQRLFPIYEKSENITKTSKESIVKNDQKESVNKLRITKPNDANVTRLENGETVNQPRQMHLNPYNQPINKQSIINPAEVALNTFLNSRTPEESRASLDTYIRSSQVQSTPPPNKMIMPEVNHRYGTDQSIQKIPQVDQNQLHQMTQINQQVYPQVNQQLLRSDQNYNYVNSGYSNPQQSIPGSSVVGTPVGTSISAPVGSPVASIGTPIGIQGQVLQSLPGAPASVIQAPIQTPIQPRNDLVMHPAWRYRVRGVRARPYPPMAQPRLGPALYKAPISGPYKQKEPIEVIYTRPPGFHRGPPRLSNPPVAYEDASAWFPESDHPPLSKDVYYSQLYAQSYDPHYYNYIAKTGKIRPHLYGKLGKYHDDRSDGIWSELYKGFTKHGLKNIMTPSFLLGMTIPAALTLMISMLVQKRSFSRADSRSMQQDLLQEYLERVQRAMDYYERRKEKEKEKE